MGWTRNKAKMLLCSSSMVEPDVVSPNSNKHLIDTLRRSKLFRNYEKVFSEATGLPLTLQAGRLLAVGTSGEEASESVLRYARRATCHARGLFAGPSGYH